MIDVASQRPTNRAAWSPRYATALFLFVTVGGCRDDAEITSGLTEVHANRVLVALQDQGIASAHLFKDRSAANPFAVRVAANEEPAARRMLVELDLLEPPGSRLSAPFASAGLVPSPTAERARLMAGLGESLGRSLESIPGVVRARVHVMLPESDETATFHAQTVTPPSASVLLVCAREANENNNHGESASDGWPMLAADVQAFVAAAVENLSPDAVTVVYSATTPLPKRETRASAPSEPASGRSRRAWEIGFLAVVGLLATVVAALSLRRRGLSYSP